MDDKIEMYAITITGSKYITSIKTIHPISIQMSGKWTMENDPYGYVFNQDNTRIHIPFSNVIFAIHKEIT